MLVVARSVVRGRLGSEAGRGRGVGLPASQAGWVGDRLGAFERTGDTTLYAATMWLPPARVGRICNRGRRDGGRACRPPRSVAEILAEHTTLELECVDRMYLNVYVPLLQTAGGVAWYLRDVCGFPVASSVLLGRRSHQFVAAIKRFVRKQGIDLIRFQRGERKDDRAQDYLRRWSGREGCCSSASPRRRRTWCVPVGAASEL